MQTEILARLHERHMGISKCRVRAQQSVWWLGLSSQIAKMVAQCEICLRRQPQHTEPMIPSPLPRQPWQKLGADLLADLFFQKGTTYLLIDYFSRYIEIEKMPITTVKSVIQALKAIFSRHGVPETLISDNGQQFASSEFSAFAADYDFIHITSSPYFSQSNGEAERAVKTSKILLLKNHDPYCALLAYRVTQLLHGPSPAEMLMGRKLRSPLPQAKSQLEPRWPNR